MNLYRDDDIVAQLEAKISNLNLEENDSQLKKDLASGSTNVRGEQRNVKAAKRKTDTGKNSATVADKDRAKGDAILKANMKTADDKDDDDSDWESAEEDAPAIRLEELLSNMKLDDGTEKPESEGSEEEEEEK